MKIGLVVYGSLETVSGGYLYDRSLVNSLQERGHAVRVHSLPWRNYASRLSDNLSFGLPPDLDVLIQDELVHPSLLAANRLPHPYPVISLVHHLRSSEEPSRPQNFFYRFIERSYLRSADGFIFSSKTTRQAVHALIGAGKPSLIANPPTDRFKRVLTDSAVAARAVQTGPMRILFVGNLIPRKGLSVLLSAISALPAGSVRLDVVGSQAADPLYVKKVTDQVADQGLRDSVVFHGILDDESLQKELEAAHILVVPSSYEGYGIVYLEGMAFGLPAIGTTAGAAGEIIKPRENGFLIRPGDAAALTVYLLALMTDRSLMKQLSLNALASYRQRAAWDQTVESIHQFLAGLVG
jgi:glycosyltransferase involved in cell wall biosynthesis